MSHILKLTDFEIKAALVLLKFPGEIASKFAKVMWPSSSMHQKGNGARYSAGECGAGHLKRLLDRGLARTEVEKKKNGYDSVKYFATDLAVDELSYVNWKLLDGSTTSYLPSCSSPRNEGCSGAIFKKQLDK